MLKLPNGILIDMSQPFAMTIWGAGGPRIVTSRFSWSWSEWEGPSYSISLSADLDAKVYQSEGDMWRRTARAVVPLAKKLAVGVAAGTVAPRIRRQNPDWLDASYAVNESFEGLARYVGSHISFKLRQESGDEVPRAIRDIVRDETHRIATGLHLAASDPEFAFLRGFHPLVVKRQNVATAKLLPKAQP